MERLCCTGVLLLPQPSWLGRFLICFSTKSIAFQDNFKQHKLFCMKCIKKAHISFINVSSGQSIFHWIWDHKHLVSGNCSCSWAELRYMVSLGLQMMGREEDTEDDGICFSFFMVWLHSVGHICGASAFLTGMQILRIGPKFRFSHAQYWVKHFKLSV